MASVAEFFEQTSEQANKDAIQGMDCVYQFRITGEGGGDWNVVIRDGEAAAAAGLADNPNITLTMAAEDFLDLVQGKLDGQTAFLTGKVKIEGDMGLALRLGSVFSIG